MVPTSATLCRFLPVKDGKTQIRCAASARPQRMTAVICGIWSSLRHPGSAMFPMELWWRSEPRIHSHHCWNQLNFFWLYIFSCIIAVICSYLWDEHLQLSHQHEQLQYFWDKFWFSKRNGHSVFLRPSFFAHAENCTNSHLQPWNEYLDLVFDCLWQWLSLDLTKSYFVLA